MTKILKLGFIVFLFTVIPVTLTALLYQKSLTQERIFWAETSRLEAINLTSDYYWLSSDQLRKKLICKVYYKDRSIKNLTDGYSEKFLRSADVFPELRSHAESVYELFDVAESDLRKMCKRG